MELKLRIRIILLMCKFESQVQVIRVLKNEKVSNVPSSQTITKLYKKFLEFGQFLKKIPNQL